MHFGIITTKQPQMWHSNRNSDGIYYFVGNVRSRFVKKLQKVLKFTTEMPTSFFVGVSIGNGLSTSSRMGDELFFIELMMEYFVIALMTCLHWRFYCYSNCRHKFFFANVNRSFRWLFSIFQWCVKLLSN
jgi:hypothetical protein